MSERRRPNVLFLISDQHSAKVLGRAGHPDVKTPNLDRLIDEGVRFENAYTQNPICTPSRMTYFTGQYVHNHGYYGLMGRKPDHLPTIFGHFRHHGYRTAAIGKIHCNIDWISADCDHFAEVYAYERKGREITSDADLTPYEEYLKEIGKLDKRDDDRFHEQGPGRGQGLDARPSELTYEESVEGWIVRDAKRFIDECCETPWCIQVSLPLQHQMYAPAEAFWNLYDEEKLTLPPNADASAEGYPPHMRKTRDWQRNTPPAIFEPSDYESVRRRKLHGYLGCVSQVDHAAGELMDYLRERGLEEDTIVVYTADHGEYATEHGLLEKAPGICTDSVCRIPHVWRWSGHFPAGKTSGALVETVDLASTLPGLCGIPAFESGDGRDIGSLLAGEDAPVRDFAVTEHPWSKSIRKGKWRMVHYPDGMFEDAAPGERIGQLYDLEADPWETNNLYHDPEHQDVVRELTRDLFDWLIRTTRVVNTLSDVSRPGEETEVRFDDPGHRYDPDGKVAGEALGGAGNKNYI